MTVWLLLNCVHCSGQAEVARALLLAGADPNARACGATPLHRASFAGHEEVVHVLVHASAEVNVPDVSFGDLRPALHKACSQGHDRIARLLLAAGADPVIRDARGLDAAAIASDAGFVELAALVRADSSCRDRAAADGGESGRVRVATSGVVTLDEYGAALCNAVFGIPPSAESSPSAPPARPPPAETASASSSSAVLVGTACSICHRHMLEAVRSRCCGALTCAGCARRIRSKACPQCASQAQALS